MRTLLLTTGALFLCALSLPALAAPAVSWEDEFFGYGEDETPHADIFAPRTDEANLTTGYSDNMVAPVYGLPYRPTYVAPPAPPPPPAPITIDDEGAYCRPYSQRTEIDGTVQETYGTVCLDPDGTWHPAE